MALTRDFRETVYARAQKDGAFRKALLTEGVNAYLGGDEATGKAVLRDMINATIGFEQLAADLQTYQLTVATTDFPAQVASQATAVTSAAAAASAKLEQLAGLGSNPQAYVSAVNGAGLEAAFQQVDSTTRSLNAALLVL